MFEHEYFDHYAFEEIPLGRDLYLMDAASMAEYEQYMLAVFEGRSQEPPGAVGFAAARGGDQHAIQLSWYPNIFTRFHEVAITLPRGKFVRCVGSWRYDEKPHIFVDGDWLNNLYARSYCAFALVDAIGVKNALATGALTREKLLALRGRIDELAARHPSVAFISFADSLLLKSNWTPDGDMASYAPESFIALFCELQAIYREVLGLEAYAVLAQGGNEYYADDLLHTSPSGNHVCLNSLGIPFAQLIEIDRAVRQAIKSGVHGKHELYIDQLFYHSLKFGIGFDKHAEPHGSYTLPLTGTEGSYYCGSAAYLQARLEPQRSSPA